MSCGIPRQILTMSIATCYSIYTHPFGTLSTLLKTKNQPRQLHFIIVSRENTVINRIPPNEGWHGCFLLQRGRCIAPCGRLENEDDWRLQKTPASFSGTLLCFYL